MNVKAVIKEKGYTTEKVAGKLGITRVTPSQTLSRNPTVNTLRKISEAIGCNISDFFKDEEGNNTTIVCPYCGKPIKIEFKKATD